ncbi:LacI family transcriptional regulator [Kibdelosporangium banguiense]|uniref:LacI family transcriptional regulator n=1 Tax=Kibdelosporangium banguiense TaxID=1365924 RepID=A0ABS4TNH2_9PSEU|nr:substrate-binding domain-containing protein [Kibdelosporangium banguiense]MBP2325948.1 LacI family transcriptional regulator [Kibdelosporangium banguiense]
MAASIKDVAKLAGVSVGTVSNVLNRPGKVAAGTRELVFAAIAELGFVRNSPAAQLRAGTSHSLGMVVLDMTNPFFQEVARGAEDVAVELGNVLMLCNSDEQVGRENGYLQVLEEQRVRGVLITPVTVSSERLDALRRRGTPTVLVDRSDPRGDCCSVAVDDIAGGELAGAHLLAQGHDRITYITGPLSLRQCADRLTGLRRAVIAAGKDPDICLDVLETPALKAKFGYEAALAAIESTVDAIFCANDLLALGALRAAVQTGRRIPDDIALLGYDDIEFAADAAVSLSSIRQPAIQIGRQAARLLLDECDHPDTHAHQQITFKPELVVRESTQSGRSN